MSQLLFKNIFVCYLQGSTPFDVLRPSVATRLGARNAVRNNGGGAIGNFCSYIIIVTI